MNELTEDTVRPLKMYWHYNCTRTIIVPLRRVPSEKRSQSCILQTGAEQVDHERAREGEREGGRKGAHVRGREGGMDGGRERAHTRGREGGWVGERER